MSYKNITHGICSDCVARPSANSVLLESIDAPVLLMQGNPRQVVTANRKALELFGKELHEVENHRGGEVFDCVHSFTEAGCGKDVNCESCKIRNAIVDTFVTATSLDGVSTELSIKKPAGTRTFVLQVSTEKVGDLALVRIDRYKPVHSALQPAEPAQCDQ
jgi:transcriptional regulator of aromatic amino acid metabolism